MPNERIEFLSAVLLISKNPARLADFYKDVLRIPLEVEEHSETIKHYGCELGDLHFAIHPVENFADQNYGVGSIKLAFTVFNLDALVARLKASNVNLVYEPRDLGFTIMTAIHDPDGNYIELTQLRDSWFQHLEKRKMDGHDVVKRWKAQVN